MTDIAPKPPEGTAADLINAGLRFFGEKGFAATSTRELAAAAKTNIASIAYHFGGKDGLRMACGKEVARRITDAMATLAFAPPASPEASRAALEVIVRRLAAFVLGAPEAAPIVPFMLRELSEGGPALDIVYTSVMAPMHQRFCSLWAGATGQPIDEPGTKLAVFSMMGQVFYFRIGRPVIERRMGWAATGPEEVARITELLVANLHAQLDRGARS